MNNRLVKMVEKLQNGERASVRRDQIRKALEEKAFDYAIYKGYDEVYNVEPRRIKATIDNIENYWLDHGTMWAGLNSDKTMLEITIKHGYSYIELWASVEDKKEEIEVIAEPEQQENIIAEGVAVVFNEEKKGIEIEFSSKELATKELREQLKEVGFRWFSKYGKWIARQTEESIKLVNGLFLSNEDETQEDEELPEAVDVTEEVETWDNSADNYELINFENIEIVEVENKEILVDCLVPSLNKNCNIKENNECIKESSNLEKFKIQKIVKLNNKQYDYFTKNLLHDYSFLSGLGGWEEDENGSLLYYYGVAVVSDNRETLIIDPSGSSYARYCNQLVEDIDDTLKDELSNSFNTEIVINNSLYNEAINSIKNTSLYEVNVNDKTVINDNRYIKNVAYNGVTVATGSAIKELIAENKGIDILNLKPLRININDFKEGLYKHDNKNIFALFPTETDKQLEKIKFLDRLEYELQRAEGNNKSIAM